MVFLQSFYPMIIIVMNFYSGNLKHGEKRGPKLKSCAFFVVAVLTKLGYSGPIKIGFIAEKCV